MNAEPALNAYFAEAAGWDADRLKQRQRQLSLLGYVALAGWVGALIMALTLWRLMPLKQVQPYLIRVDNSTGIVDVVPTYEGTSALPETVTRYFLDHYVSVCERFNFSTAESDYEECGAFHGAARNQAWFTQWTQSNPQSPLNVNKDGSTVRVQVGAISFFERGSGVADLAQVRYTKKRRAAGGTDEVVTHWIATIQYAYAEPAKDAKVRRWNPLGFKVVAFNTEPEVQSDGSSVTRVVGAP